MDEETIEELTVQEELEMLEYLIRKYGIPIEILNRINGINEDDEDDYE
jgi:hypothetical protein